MSPSRNMPTSRNMAKGATQQGFTLTEVAIVLGVMGVVLSGIWTAYSRVQYQTNVNKVVKDVQTIVQNVRTLYGNRHKFNGSQTTITETLVNVGAIPDDILQVSGHTDRLALPWAGAYMYIDAPSGVGSDTFGIVMQNLALIDPNPCAAILSQVVTSTSGVCTYASENLSSTNWHATTDCGLNGTAATNLDVESFQDCTVAGFTFKLQ